MPPTGSKAKRDPVILAPQTVSAQPCYPRRLTKVLHALPKKSDLEIVCHLSSRDKMDPLPRGQRYSAAREGDTRTRAARRRHAQRRMDKRGDARRTSRCPYTHWPHVLCSPLVPTPLSLPSLAPPACDCPRDSNPTFLFSCPLAVNVEPPARETMPRTQFSLSYT